MVNLLGLRSWSILLKDVLDRFYCLYAFRNFNIKIKGMYLRIYFLRGAYLFNCPNIQAGFIKFITNTNNRY